MFLLAADLTSTGIVLLALRFTHVLASAALFGSMFYSITVVQPRAKRYFSNPADFEEFIAFISNGARWKVLSGLALIAVTGGLLILFRPTPSTLAWKYIMATKLAVFLAMTVFFSYVSWRLWPARIFATPDEIPRFQTIFRRVAITMITCTFLEFALAAAAHAF